MSNKLTPRTDRSVTTPNSPAEPESLPFRAMLDSLTAAVYATDAAGRVTYANPAAILLSGRTPEFGTDRWCASWKLYRPDGTPLPHSACPMAVALRERRAVRGEELIIERPDGSRTECMPYPTPLWGPDGTLVGAINMLVDISDRKRAEDELRDSEQRFVGFMQHLPGLAWIKDRAGRYVYANAAAEDAFNRPLKELVGRTDREIFPPDTAAEFALNDRQVIARDAGIQTVEKLAHADGSLHYSVVSKFPIPGRDGATALIGGVAIDVTGLKQAEEALRRSEAWFRTLAEASPALIWRIDRQGRLAYVNPPLLDYFGKPLDDLLAHGWEPLLHPDDAAGHLSAIAAAQRERTRLQTQVRVRNRHGACRWLESYALPLLGDEREYLGHIGTSLDVTERKEFERVLSEADNRKDEFLAMLAHELRSPLAPIHTSIEILRRTADPGLQPVVHTLDRQVRQLVRLVDDLLDVSRIGRGHVELKRQRVDLRTIVQFAIEAVQPLCLENEQELSVSLPDMPVHVEADAVRIGQVVGNLLSNASKFTDRGGRIAISLETGTGALAEAVVRVADNGIGIAAEQITRIFDLFMQVDTSLERAAAGLGVGLTLVKRLVDMHGGTVEVRSDGIGHGSEFVVRLPTLPQEPAVAGAAADSRSGSTPQRVLVVDDNRDAADLLATLLRLGGHETVVAYDGLDAVDAAERFRPDVILLDIGLPRLNGFEAARRIRQRRAGRVPKIVALTGWGQESDRRATEDAGFDAHLVKPVDESTLVRVLEQIRGDGSHDGS